MKRALLLVLAIAILVGCSGPAGGQWPRPAVLSTNTPTPFPSLVPTPIPPMPTHTPVPTQTTVLLFEEIRASFKGKSEAQWRNYLWSLTGMWVTWTGWVFDERGGELLIDMDSPDRWAWDAPNVRFDVPAGVALSFNKGQEITFFGQIERFDDLRELIVSLREVTIHD